MSNITIRLSEIAHARSGDKGSMANIGLIAYNESGYQFLKDHVTAAVVDRFFKALGVTSVERYELLNLHAFNFILQNILVGGGSRSLRIDAQGKALGQVLLQMPIEIPVDLYEKAKRRGA